DSIPAREGRSKIGGAPPLALLAARVLVQFPQLEALKLSCSGLGDLLQKLDPAWPFISADLLGHPIRQLGGEFFARRVAAVHDNIGNRFGQAGVIFSTDDRGLQNSRVGNQRTLHLRWAEPTAVDLEKIVRAAGIPKISVLVLVIFV